MLRRTAKDESSNLPPHSGEVALKVARAELELETIVNRIDRKELDLRPDFQRGEIWDRPRKQRLIDSILRDWYVPAIHIVESPNGDEEVLDGQQRLAAIRDFFHDDFPVNGKTEPQDDRIEALHGKKFSSLPIQYQKNLRRFELPVVRLREFAPSEPNELFFRLNQSYTLTPPEKRNALHGPARNQVKSLVVSLEKLGFLTPEKVGFSNGRLAYDDIIARTCVALQHGDLSVHINNSTVEDFYRTREFDAVVLEGVVDSANDILQMISRSDERIRFNKGSLFSWLVFCFWYPRVLGTEVPQDALALFEGIRLNARRGGEFSTDLSPLGRAAVAAYDDRAAYRVTDVSSVLIRDVSLQIFVGEAFHAPYVKELKPLLDLPIADHNVLVKDIARFVDMDKWDRVLRKAIAI